MCVYWKLLQFKLHVSQIVFKKFEKKYFKEVSSIIAHIIKIYEEFKCLLGISQTSTCNLIIE